MTRPRRSLRRETTVVAALVLVAATLVGSGHHHADHTASDRACAVCVVSRHTPGVVAVTIDSPVPVLRVASLQTAPLAATPEGVARVARGRAPPHTASAYVG